jgi:hypothetical protein
LGVVSTIISFHRLSHKKINISHMVLGGGELHTKALTYPNITISSFLYHIIMWRNPHLPKLVLKPDSSIVSNTLSGIAILS